LLLLPLHGHGRILHVPSEYTTIQKGINASSDGDTVLVCYGVYYENIRFHCRRILLTSWLGGEDARPTRPIYDEATIDGSYPSDPDSSAAVYFVDGEDSDSVIRGFTITHDGYHFGRARANGEVADREGRANGEGIVCDRASPMITGNLIVGNSPHGIRYRDEGQDRTLQVIGNEIRWNATPGYGGGILIEQSIGPCGSNALIWANLISGNTAGCGGAVAVRFAQSNKVILRRNVISHNTATGGAGIWTAKGHSDLILEHNVFVDNEGAAVTVADYDPGSHLIAVNNTITGNTDGFLLMYGESAVIRNNIVTGNGSGITRGGFMELSISYNDVWDNDGLDYVDCSAGVGDISADPLFAGGVPFNYGLTGDSPCIDAGDPTGPPDPDGTRADIGALYYHQSWAGVNGQSARLSLAAAPNPFRSASVISCDLPARADRLELAIHDVCGRLVRRLTRVEAGPGTIEFIWNGETESGTAAACGLYFCRLSTCGGDGGQEAVIKLAKMR
ncbi:right-handed parallel beta-helix repeat-containing protein, partial [bacterium]|nr:right-handed parallel beta-helix repeat-containing protein [bacterium]